MTTAKRLRRRRYTTLEEIRCITPSAYPIDSTNYPGCAARPWALSCNCFAVMGFPQPAHFCHTPARKFLKLPLESGAMAMRIFFSVGEPSGDLHGANLIRALHRRDASIECIGLGGPRMAEAGCRLHADLTKFAVMWFFRVLVHLPQFWRLAMQARKYFREHRPDAVVLIDYPGFNWWIARYAKKQGIPVVYYGVPQIWAWARWRVKKMRRLVDLALCKLPFEAEWYQSRGCNARFVGHPYFDELSQHSIEPEFRRRMSDGRPLVTILPGSRTQEVENNLTDFLKVAELIHEKHPQVKFAIASLNDAQAQMARDMASQFDLPLQIYVGRTTELIALSHSCLACSGSVSLELVYFGRPAVILYRVQAWFYVLVRFFVVRVRYMTLANLLCAKDRFEIHKARYDPDSEPLQNVPLPEYPTWRDRSVDMANHVNRWLAGGSDYAQRCQRLQQLRDELAGSGASEKAVGHILSFLASDSDESLPAAA